MTEAIFTATALTKTYVTGEVQVHALSDVDLEIAERKWSCCSARPAAASPRCSTSWAGSIMPTSGRLFFKDLELTGLDDRGLTAYRRRHVGFVFQFYNLVPEPDRL